MTYIFMQCCLDVTQRREPRQPFAKCSSWPLYDHRLGEGPVQCSYDEWTSPFTQLAEVPAAHLTACIHSLPPYLAIRPSI